MLIQNRAKGLPMNCLLQYEETHPQLLCLIGMNCILYIMRERERERERERDYLVSTPFRNLFLNNFWYTFPFFNRPEEFHFCT